jgi:hypothetical protein
VLWTNPPRGLSATAPAGHPAGGGCRCKPEAEADAATQAQSTRRSPNGLPAASGCSVGRSGRSRRPSGGRRAWSRANPPSRGGTRCSGLLTHPVSLRRPRATACADIGSGARAGAGGGENRWAHDRIAAPGVYGRADTRTVRGHRRLPGMRTSTQVVRRCGLIAAAANKRRLARPRVCTCPLTPFPPRGRPSHAHRGRRRWWVLSPY